MSEYFLGIDGGQSGTTAVIGDRAGRVVGWANAGPCNHVAATEARAKFLRVMRECITDAADRAGIPDNRFQSACFGMSGGPADKEALLRELIDAEHWMVTHDAAIALAGATSGEPGIVAIAGTGSMVFGQNSRGEIARVGGWGYLFGDEGSGFDIARQALRAVMREHEGWGGRTVLTPALVEAGGVPGAQRTAASSIHTRMAETAHRRSRADRGSRRGRRGPDRDGYSPERRARTRIAGGFGAPSAMGRRRSLTRVSWAGGAFRSRILLERFRLLVSIEANNTCEPPKHGPAIGALLLAWRAAGIRAEPQSPAGTALILREFLSARFPAGSDFPADPCL